MAATAAAKNSDSGARASGSGTAARATGITILFVLLSRVLGIVRDIVIAHQFGQNDQTTIYTRAFAVPDLIALVIAGGAVSAVFIPVFAEYWNNDRENDAWRIFGSILSIVSVAATVLIIGMELAVVPLTAVLNPQFSPSGIQEAAALTRILLPGQLCFLIGGLMMGTLYARKRFLIPALGPCIYNLFIIISGVVLGRKLGISALAWGALMGAFVGNILLPLWDMGRAGVRWVPGFDTRHPGVRKVGKLMIPVLLGLSLSQLIMWITGYFLGDDERLTALQRAYNLTQAPIGIFAQAFAIVLLPTISTHAAQEDWPAFRMAISTGLRRVFFLTVPASVLMTALAVPLVRGMFLGGKFTEANVQVAAHALLYYSISTFAWSAISILARGFYARQDTLTPILITTPMVFIFGGMAAIYHHLSPAGYTGYASITSLVGIVTMLLMLYLLQVRVGGLNMRGIVLGTTRITIASLISGAVTVFLTNAAERHLHPGRMLSLLILVGVGGLALVLYVGICALMKAPELKGIGEMFRRGRSGNSGETMPPTVSAE